MNIVMDFDGVFTDPTEEGELCQKYFLERIQQTEVLTKDQIASWFGELRARLASGATLYGWRSEGRLSAFSFEDPFIRAIGFADYLDALVSQGDEKAKSILKKLNAEEIASFGALSEWAFHQLRIVKKPDPETVNWVRKQKAAGHTITIVSNSSPEKIQEFLKQNNLEKEVAVRGNAKKFALGKKPKKLKIGQFEFDVDRPGYQEALIELQPDTVIGDVFSLDLALPISLKREGKIPLTAGVFYRKRAYTPNSLFQELTTASQQPPELHVLENWSRLSFS